MPIQVEVIVNGAGTYISELWRGSPVRSHGPFDEPMSVPQALIYVATQMELTKGD